MRLWGGGGKARGGWVRLGELGAKFDLVVDNIRPFTRPPPSPISLWTSPRIARQEQLFQKLPAVLGLMKAVRSPWIADYTNLGRQGSLGFRA